MYDCVSGSIADILVAIKRITKSAQQRKWVDNRLKRHKDERTNPRSLTYLERKRRLDRIRETGLTPEDAWAVHCCPDPFHWTAHWFNIPVSRVKLLQASGNEGKPWTAKQKAEMGKAFGGTGQAEEAPEPL